MRNGTCARSRGRAVAACVRGVLGGAHRPVSRALLASLVSAVALAAHAAPAPALLVGLSDQDPASLQDPRFAALPIDHARLVVPWDAAYTTAAAVDAWLAAATARGLTPLVAFERGYGETCPAACAAPTVAAYADAVQAFHARWPAVRELAPWNEPNHPAQPTARDPALAAGYHDALRRACPDCTVVACDLVDSANMKSYFRAYAAALRTAPQVWGIHDYGDVTYDRPSYLQWLTEQVTTPVWVTETGGIVRLGSGTNASLPEDPDRAAASIDRAFALAAAQPDRVVRLYLYQWRARPGDDFDAGLVAPDGAERPALARLRANLGLPTAAPAPGPGTASPMTTAPAVTPAGDSAAPRTVTTAAASTTIFGAAPPLTVSRPARVRGGVDLRVDCPAARRGGCAGSVTVLLQVLFRPAPVRLARAAVRLRPGAHRVLRLAVGRSARRSWNRAAAWELRTVSVIRAPTGVQERTWKARRPGAPHRERARGRSRP
jgi:Glycosyl hydrolase catalytic core